MDYVGNQRSPLWDDMEAMEDENAKITQEVPSMESEIERLRSSLVEAQRKTRMIELYKQADPEGTVSQLTQPIEKLCFHTSIPADLTDLFTFHRMLSRRRRWWRS